jgi:hypothetical protein
VQQQGDQHVSEGKRTPLVPYRTVELHVDGRPAPVDGDGFRLCPLGVQFRSQAAVEPYAEMSIDVVLPSDREDLPTRKIKVRGMVVQCDPSGEDGDHQYKVAMYFVDLDNEHYELIREASQCLPTLCPDCNLF